jgi:hypothetical protein
MTPRTTVVLWVSIATSICTLLILIVNAYYVVKFRESVDIQRKTSQGTLLMTLNNQLFYTEPHKRIIRCLEEGKSLRAKACNVSDEDLDDYIGMLDTIGTFTRAKILDADLVYKVFSHYVESAHESSEISEYVKQCRQEDPSLFSDFIWLYEKMEEQELAGKK